MRSSPSLPPLAYGRLPMRRLATILLLVLLVGCAQIRQGIDAKRAYNDAKAGVLIQGVCDMSLGASLRIAPADKRAADALCGGEPLPQ